MLKSNVLPACNTLLPLLYRIASMQVVRSNLKQQVLVSNPAINSCAGVLIVHGINYKQCLCATVRTSNSAYHYTTLL